MILAHFRTTRSLLLGVLAAAVLLAAGELLAAEEPADPRLDPARLNEIVQVSVARLSEKGARWTAVTTLKEDREVLVGVVQFGGQRKYVLTVRAGAREAEVLQIIERDGSWYVKEPHGAFGKYRPYEAPFFYPTAYVFLQRAEPHFTPDDVDALGTLEKINDGVAVFRHPLPEQTRAFIRQIVSQSEALEDKLPNPAELREQRRKLEDILEHGLPTELNLTTGMITAFGTVDVRTRIRGFMWLDSVPPDTFDVEGDYPDFTSDPTDADLDECVMIGHFGGWDPGMKRGGDTDARLLNLKTGELRRIPFRGMVSMPGCFLKDRGSVVVSGMMMDVVGLGLYEINLSTGENRELGRGAFEGGFCANPCLSPDGKLIAVKWLGSAEAWQPSVIYVVDVESGEARKIGEIVGGIWLSWMPDGKRILMMREEFEGLDKRSKGTICTMALDGTIKGILPGEQPLLIGGDRIMFTPRDEELWHTCGLDGSDVKILGDGLREYGFPTPSPDGTRLLMMHFGTRRGPRPTIIKIGESEGKEATSIRGLWAWPAWR